MKQAKPFSITVRILGILLAVLLVLVIIIEDDSWFKRTIEKNLITQFTKASGSNFTTKVSRIRLLAAKIELTDTQATAPATETSSVNAPGTHASSASAVSRPAWGWHADHMTIKFSWFDLLWHRKLKIDLVIKNLVASSEFGNDRPTIIAHLQKLIAPGDVALPFELKRFQIQQGQLTGYKDDTITGNINFRTDLVALQKQGQAMLTVAAIFNNGKITLSGNNSIEAAEGKLSGTIVLGKPDHNKFELTSSAQVAWGAHTSERLNIIGTLQGAISTLQFSSASHALEGTLTIDTQKDTGSLLAQLPLAVAAAPLVPKYATSLGGTCHITATAQPSMFMATATATITVDNASYRALTLPQTTATIALKNTLIKGTLQSTLGTSALEGSYTVSPTEKMATLTVVSTSPIALPEDWNIAEKGLSATIKMYGSGEINANYTALFKRHEKEQKLLKGILNVTPDHIIIQGTGEKFTYDFLAAAKPFWHLEYLDCHLDKELVIALKAESPEQFAGTIGYPLVRFLLSSAGFYVPGEGLVNVKGTVNQRAVNLAVTMKGANIRLPYTYNLLQNVQGNLTYTFADKRITIDKVHIGLYKGTMTASQITALFQDNYQLSFVHAPLILNNCFFSRKKEFFALFSGAMTFEYQKTKPADKGRARVSGYVALDRSHIQSNIFSQEFRKQLFGVSAAPFSFYGSDIDFNIRLITQSLLHVKTSFLEAAARINLGLIGSASSPTVTGGIELVSGTLHFPYKSLFIKRGHIYFLPQQIDDPVIELLAENSIKQFAVRMTVDGSVSDPHISFSSSPSLQEEQIIGLLLGGSEDGSLYLAMPTSVMSSIENLLFGPANSTSKFQRTLQNLFSPLKNLRITPRFSDQTGRGGLRGALTIDVNDRLRGIIEQNFSLSEDTLIEVEYDLSDDARVRAIKDERGDLGGEIEGRWKF